MQILYGKLWLSLASRGSCCLFCPLGFIAIKRARRMAAFEKGFPEVIDLLSRSVRAGHSFASGLEIVATDLPDPVATEFRITFDEQRFGLPLRDALINLCERVPLIDVRLFVIALLVQKETGGNLVEILDNLAHVIRERFRIAGEVRVRTAQGRLTAILLMALPLGMIVILHFIDPEYIKLLFTERLGQMMLIVAAAMQILAGSLFGGLFRSRSEGLGGEALALCLDPLHRGIFGDRLHRDGDYVRLFRRVTHDYRAARTPLACSRRRRWTV